MAALIVYLCLCSYILTYYTQFYAVMSISFFKGFSIYSKTKIYSNLKLVLKSIYYIKPDVRLIAHVRLIIEI